ncbi:MAG TPA: hypothetical protein VGK58_12950 [Lacipirellulaceae bacterium]
MLKRPFTRAGTMAFVAVCVVGHALPLSGRDFAVRQVTDFGDPTNGSRATPLGVINDRLLFVAIENGVSGLYRTDGLNVELIDNSAEIHVDEVAQLNNELFFAGAGANGRELYASDGQSLRLVADLAPDSLNANPRNFNVLNGHLVFTGVTSDASVPGGAPIRFFRTDGTTVEEFPFAPFSLSGSVKLGDRLVFGGIPPGGGQLMLRATDGGSIFDIATPHGNIISPPRLTRVSDHAYFVAGDGVERGVYRTDGIVAERIAAFDSFTHLDQVQHTFENQGDFIFTMHDRIADELIFYRTGGESVMEVTRWAIPSGINLHPLVDPQPEFSDGSRAFFEFQHFQNGLVHEIYVFDGSSFGLFLSNPTKKFSFKEVNGRVFVNESSANPTLYELVDGSLVPFGTALDAMFEFQGEIFGWNRSIPSFFSAATLWQIQSGTLKPLGDVVSQSAQPTGPFVEFRGELYFAGQMGSFPSEIRDRQLYAIFAVPEPASSALALVVLTTLLVLRGRLKRFGHEK